MPLLLELLALEGAAELFVELPESPELDEADELLSPDLELVPLLSPGLDPPPEPSEFPLLFEELPVLP